jgi:cbb3-type cytochrome oxidase subunit 3
MKYLIFGGDMLVMAFMIAVVVWISLRENKKQIDAAARIPLEDE